MSMRIGVLTRVFPTLSSTPFMNQVTGLIERGHRVEVYADVQEPGESHPDVERLGLLDHTRYYERPPPRLQDRLRPAARLIRSHHGADRTVLLRGLNPLAFWRRAFSLELLWRAARFLPPRPFDVVYCPFGQDARPVIRLRRLGALADPMVVAFRGSDITRYIAQRGRRVYRATFREAALLLPVCDAFARSIVELGAPVERVVVHRTGIALRRWHFKTRRLTAGEPLRLVTVGRLVEKKGIEYAIRAVRLLVDRGIDAAYEIVGDGPVRARLLEVVEACGLGDRVKLLGHQNEPRVAEALDRAHVMVAPSLTAANGDAEGVPNVLKEAMATGLPVVSTHHSGIPELVEHGTSGFLVAERDPDALADSVAWLVRHPERWGEMGWAGRARVERDYDIEVLNDRLVTLLERVAGYGSTTSLT